MRELTVKPFEFSMLGEIHEWWAVAGFAKLPVELLPVNGLVVSIGDELACAGWLYRSDSALGYLEWIVANPDVRREPRDKALNLLISTLLARAKGLGIKLIFSSIHHELLAMRLEKHGFIKTDRNMTNLVWRA